MDLLDTLKPGADPDRYGIPWKCGRNGGLLRRTADGGITGRSILCLLGLARSGVFMLQDFIM